MTDLTIPQLTELVYKAIPHPHQIHDLAFEESAIRFRWRGQHFRVSRLLGVETVGNGVLIGDDASILLRELIAITRAAASIGRGEG